MASCPSCRRPVALARATCLYCGATLSPESVSAARPVSAVPPVGTMDGDTRLLVVLDLAGVPPETLARALDLPPYEAGLLVKRGGLHLNRVLEGAAAAVERRR